MDITHHVLVMLLWYGTCFAMLVTFLCGGMMAVLAKKPDSEMFNMFSVGFGLPKTGG